MRSKVPSRRHFLEDSNTHFAMPANREAAVSRHSRSAGHRAKHSRWCVDYGVAGAPSELPETAVRAASIRHRSGWWDRDVSSSVQPISPCRSLSTVSCTPENQRAATRVCGMDWLTETPAYGTTLAPQLLGVKILEICACALLLLTLLTVMVGWVRHLSRHVRLLTLVPLAASIAAGITAHVFHDTYVYWVSLFDHLPPTAPPNPNFINGIANANQAATVLGWIFVIVTGVLFVLGLFDLWHRVMPERPGSLSTAPI
jgi:hypothetical protein